MSTKRLFALLVPLVLLLAVVGTTSAAASPPTLATGTVGNTSSTFNDVRAADGNLIIHLSGTAVYTGTFTGTSTFEGILIIHPDGSANFHDVETFTGTVNGIPGAVTFNLTGHNDSDLVVHETRTVTGATGGLAGLHGVLHEFGTVVVPTGPVTTYSGKIEFAGT